MPVYVSYVSLCTYKWQYIHIQPVLFIGSWVHVLHWNWSELQSSKGTVYMYIHMYMLPLLNSNCVQYLIRHYSSLSRLFSTIHSQHWEATTMLRWQWYHLHLCVPVLLCMAVGDLCGGQGISVRITNLLVGTDWGYIS